MPTWLSVDVPETVTPDSFQGVAAALAGAAAQGVSVRIAGGGTKGLWGTPTRQAGQILLSTTQLDQLIEHNPGDLTAVVGAGMRLGRLQSELALSGQMLALDPPRGEDATLGGIFATSDSGPLRHRYGTPRDQILGVTVALADGSVARSGSKVIKNVAGYDLGRLFCGSFGTLGVIVAVTVRLHPRPDRTATALGMASDATQLAAAAAVLADAPLELRALDVAWRGGRGGLLAQVAGSEAPRRAARAAALMTAAGLTGVEVTSRDGDFWDRQRAGQRSTRRALVRVTARRSHLPALLGLADRLEATVVGRAGVGLSYLELDLDRMTQLRLGLPGGAYAELLDRPPGRPSPAGEPWGTPDEPGLALMRAVKARFDPAGVCNPGLFVGGI